MYLGGVLLLCCVFLIFTGCADGALRRTRILPGHAAALCVLALLVSPVELPLGTWGAAYPSALVLAASGAILAHRERALCKALVLSNVLGVLGWLLDGMLPAVEETGALIAVPTVLLLGILMRDARLGLCVALLAPLFCGAAAALEDWYLFDATRVLLGTRIQMDAQLCGAVGVLAVTAIPDVARRARTGRNLRADRRKTVDSTRARPL